MKEKKYKIPKYRPYRRVLAVQPAPWNEIVTYRKGEVDTIWPCTIVKARYGGVYEGGEWLAFPLYFERIPEDVHGDDITCASFFDDTTMIIGRGKDPDSAIKNLLKLLDEAPEYEVEI